MDTKKKTNLSLVLVAAVIVVVVIIAVIIAGISIANKPEIIQGQIETGDYRVSSKVPARVLEIRVQEGDTVCAGDTLVILEAPDVEAKLAQANAAREAAEALQRKASNGAQREQIEGAFQMWQKAKAAAEVAEKSYNRVNRLFEQGVLAEQKRDEAYAQYQAMVATEKAAKSQYDMAVSGARAEDKSAAAAQVARAQGAISEVSSYIDETVLTASQSGVVTEVYPEVGELVGSGAPLLNVAKLNDVWFVFNVREDRLPGMTVGSEIEVYVPAFNKTVKAKISRIKEVGSYAVWKATKSLDQYDLKTFEVKALPADQKELAGVRPGMSAILE
ncbi:MAG: efflux RND transporter periplasmic adaptor subunit [Bacteroides sp.]|nr:efflux RND transporter periplasmic adaptor subunit [Bacteroides sp.]MCM1379241.1 efflux RND transporter periplasmic adaptor subunit [Bacteroides sp.]MCM1445101.1 efflux RND transporter periplasmic adaptor subunit [Prevotella sp.]